MESSCYAHQLHTSVKEIKTMTSVPNGHSSMSSRNNPQNDLVKCWLKPALMQVTMLGTCTVQEADLEYIFPGSINPQTIISDLRCPKS